MNRLIMQTFVLPMLLLSLVSAGVWAASGDDVTGKIRSVTDSDQLNPVQKVTNLSWRPRAFLYENFLTDQECDHVINLAKDKLTRTMVVNGSGHSVENEARTCSGMFLYHQPPDEIVTRIEDRIAAWTFLPAENAEALQVLKYEKGQKYEPHTDYHTLGKGKGGQRVATVLMYLSDVTFGGETVFPWGKSERTIFRDDSWSECGKAGLAVKPRKGDALLFYNVDFDGSVDRNSRHQACPVIEGEKWSLTRWIHEAPYK